MKLPASFIFYADYRDCMKEITGTRKFENGIVVFWDEQDGSVYELFDYPRLIDMKINVLDLLQNTRLYRIDELAHRIVSFS